MSEQTAKRRPGNPHWTKGVSGNPAGRKPNALSFAERVREKVDPDELIERALQVVRSDDDDAAMRAAQFLHSTGWSKPPAQFDVTAQAAVAPVRDWSAMPLDERRALLAAIKRVPLLPAGDDGTGS